MIKAMVVNRQTGIVIYWLGSPFGNKPLQRVWVGPVQASGIETYCSGDEEATMMQEIDQLVKYQKGWDCLI
jgi:hypothetical protein